MARLSLHDVSVSSVSALASQATQWRYTMIRDIIIEARREPILTAFEMLVTIGLIWMCWWMPWFVAVVAVATGVDGVW